MLDVRSTMLGERNIVLRTSNVVHRFYTFLPFLQKPKTFTQARRLTFVLSKKAISEKP
jgi:hypothetical protein